MIKKHFINAETKDGQKVQLTIGELTYQQLKPYLDQNPGAKIIIGGK